MTVVVALAAYALCVAPTAHPASLTPLVTLPGQQILDATPQSVLYRSSSDSGPLRVRDVSSGVDTAVPVRSGRQIADGEARLFDGGVLFLTQVAGGAPGSSREVDEWRTGDATSTQVGTNVAAVTLVVAGDYAIWNTPEDGGATLTRRELSTGTNVVVTTIAGNGGHDVAPNGDVVYWDAVQPFEIFRWRGGVTTKLSNAPPPMWSTFPVTDGMNTAYKRSPPCCSTAGDVSIQFSDGMSETELSGSAAPRDGGDEPDQRRHYRAAGGWIAYARDDLTQIWMRSPTGTFAHVSADTSPPTIEREIVGLAPTGQVLYNHWSFFQHGNPLQAAPNAFVSAPDVKPFPLDSYVSRAIWEANRWYVLRDSGLWRLDTDTAIVASPKEATQENSAHFELASTARSPVYECTLDGQPVTCAGDEFSVGGLAEGRHTFTAAVTDPALGEEDTTPARHEWVVDTTPPEAITGMRPVGPTNDGVLSWDPVGDGGGSGVATYQTTLNGQPGQVFPASKTSHDYGLLDGTHSWSLRATDNAGNVRDSETVTFTLDRVIPTAPAPAEPSNGAQLANPRPTFTWAASSDDRTGIAGYDVEIDGAATRAGAGTTSFTPGSDLADGTHSWRVVAIDAAGNRAAGPFRDFRIDTRSPTARISAAPNPAVTGEVVRFDAGGSTPGGAAISGYEWDLDGDGAFETDTRTTSRAERAYATMQDVGVSVRVTDAAGRSATAGLKQKVTPAPAPGPAGVSIDAGARFANDPNVMITARWPLFATEMLVSNDGGFEGATPQPLAATFPWRLDSSGADHLPQTVYVRFVGGISGNDTYQDDIILDESPPRITSATVRAARRARGRSRLRRFSVRVRAVDTVSGPALMQLATDRSRPGARKRFRPSLVITAKRAPRWVRVIDAAGNHSGWKRLTVRR